MIPGSFASSAPKRAAPNESSSDTHRGQHLPSRGGQVASTSAFAWCGSRELKDGKVSEVFTDAAPQHYLTEQQKEMIERNRLEALQKRQRKEQDSKDSTHSASVRVYKTPWESTSVAAPSSSAAVYHTRYPTTSTAADMGSVASGGGEKKKASTSVGGGVLGNLRDRIKNRMSGVRVTDMRSAVGVEIGSWMTTERR